jgi:hypothetical protein
VRVLLAELDSLEVFVKRDRPAFVPTETDLGDNKGMKRGMLIGGTIGAIAILLTPDDPHSFLPASAMLLPVVALGAAAGGIIGWVWQKVANSSAQDPDSNVHWVAIPIVRAPGPTAPPAPPPDPR